MKIRAGLAKGALIALSFSAFSKLPPASTQALADEEGMNSLAELRDIQDELRALDAEAEKTSFDNRSAWERDMDLTLQGVWYRLRDIETRWSREGGPNYLKAQALVNASQEQIQTTRARLREMKEANEKTWVSLQQDCRQSLRIAEENLASSLTTLEREEGFYAH